MSLVISLVTEAWLAVSSQWCDVRIQLRVPLVSTWSAALIKTTRNFYLIDILPFILEMLRKRAPPPSRERLKAASTRNLRSTTDSVRLSRGLNKRRTSALSTRSETAPNPESHPPSTSAPASAATNSTQFVAVPPSSGATFSQPGTSIAQLSGIGCPPVPAALTSGPYHVLSGGSGVTGTYSGESIIDFNANANHSISSVAGMPILNQ